MSVFVVNLSYSPTGGKSEDSLSPPHRSRASVSFAWQNPVIQHRFQRTDRLFLCSNIVDRVGAAVYCGRQSLFPSEDGSEMALVAEPAGGSDFSDAQVCVGKQIAGKFQAQLQNKCREVNSALPAEDMRKTRSAQETEVGNFPDGNRPVKMISHVLNGTCDA